jgi:ribosomal protein S1
MSTTAATSTKDLTPTREEFAALLGETMPEDEVFEGSVVKGTVTAIEKDLAVIDVGLKMEGRVPLREFAAPGRPSELKVGDTVEVYIERTEKRAGYGWSRGSTARSRWKASSSTRSRAASPSISTAPWRFCRAARWTCGPCATWARS